jgi:hypothetical protein
MGSSEGLEVDGAREREKINLVLTICWIKAHGMQRLLQTFCWHSVSNLKSEQIIAQRLASSTVSGPKHGEIKEIN